MSRTMIMLWWDSSKTALPTASSTVSPYPRVSQRSDASTRSGVRLSPFRSGSSPRDSRMVRSSRPRLKFRPSSDGTSASAASARTMGLFPRVVDIVPRRFPEPELERESGRQCRRKLAPADHRDVFRGGNQLAEPLHIEIQVAVVEPPEEALLDQVIEPSQVHDVAGLGIDRADHGHVQLIVVAVVVRVVAHAER